MRRKAWLVKAGGRRVSPSETAKAFYPPVILPAAVKFIFILPIMGYNGFVHKKFTENDGRLYYGVLRFFVFFFI
jgi:hypothetical protein